MAQIIHGPDDAGKNAELRGVVTTQTGPWAMVPVWILNEGLTGAELAVYVALRSFADRVGDAHPHVKTIAQRGGVAERTAERAIAVLRRKGLIETTRRYAEDGSVKGCDYHIKDMAPAIDASDVATPGATVSPHPDEAVATPPDEAVGRVPTRLSELKEHTKRTHQLEETAKSARATRLPDDWQPTPDLVAWLKAEYPNVDGRTETEKFRDFWHSETGPRTAKLRWDLTWKNWIRRAYEFTPGGVARASPKPSTTDQRVMAGLELAEQYRREANGQGGNRRAVGAGSRDGPADHRP